MNKEIIYFGDPMCSWCWGFSPTITAIHDTYGEQAPLSIVLGGLRAFNSKPMDENDKNTIRHHWESVHKTAGAQFDHSFFERDGFIYNTEPACRAVVTARTMGARDLLAFYETISRSFYSENKDTTDIETFKLLAAEAALDVEEFTGLFDSDAIKQATKDDFLKSQRLGVTGFPTLVVKENDQLALLTAGFQPFENLQPSIDQWLEKGIPNAT